MREILVRGKRADDGNWVYGFPYCESCGLCIDGIETWDGERHLIIKDTVGQYTGISALKNLPNGVLRTCRVYEGDIVKTKYGRLCVVEWFSSPTHNGWDLTVVGTVENCVHTKAPDSSDMWCSENLEVVGNIYDNPELLGDK